MTVFLSQFVINFYSEMPPQVRFALLSAAESERLSLNTNTDIAIAFSPIPQPTIDRISLSLLRDRSHNLRGVLGACQQLGARRCAPTILRITHN